MYQSNDPPASSTFPFYGEGIPDELKQGRVWVCCDVNKAPMVALKRGRRAASSTNPTTWHSYDEAVAALGTGRYAGVGRVIAEDEPFVGVDIDGCRDPKTGRIDQRGEAILRLLDSYSEVSPSSAGVKVWVRAKLPRAFVKPGLEIYPKGRYFTVTGQLLPEYPAIVEERSAEVSNLVGREFPRPKRPKHDKPYDGPRAELVDYLDLVEVLCEVLDTTGRKFSIVCPWINEHSDRDCSGTYIGQRHGGGLWFSCHHSHCWGRNWRDFRRACRPTRRAVINLKQPSANARQAVIRFD